MTNRVNLTKIQLTQFNKLIKENPSIDITSDQLTNNSLYESVLSAECLTIKCLSNLKGLKPKLMLAQIIAKSNVKILDLSSNAIGLNEEYSEFMKILSESKIESLNLSKNLIGTDNGLTVPNFLQCFPEFSNLKTIDFSHNALGDKAMGCARALKAVKTLKSVDFTNNDMDMNCIQMIMGDILTDFSENVKIGEKNLSSLEIEALKITYNSSAQEYFLRETLSHSLDSSNLVDIVIDYAGDLSLVCNIEE